MPYSNQKTPGSADVRALLDSIAAFDCSLHHFEPMPDFNRCWVLIVRHEDILIRFFWDGRDEFLTVEETDYKPAAKQYLWHPTIVPRVDVDDAREPCRYIEEVLKGKFRPKTASEPS